MKVFILGEVSPFFYNSIFYNICKSNKILDYFLISFIHDKTNNPPKKRIHKIPNIFINNGLDKFTSLDFSTNKYIPRSKNKNEPPIPSKGLFFFIVLSFV